MNGKCSKCGHSESEITVGTLNPKNVSLANHVLFTRAKGVMDDNIGPGVVHTGWYGLGILIDWLEANYNITEK